MLARIRPLNYLKGVPHKLLQITRIVVVLVSLGLIVFLLQRNEIGSQARLIVIAALGYYVVRLWVLGSRARRDRARRRGASGEGSDADPSRDAP